ncbi:integrin beta-8-like [Mercenaria mercenaria]|uniref:integrin beta-8-like n=1 Tax=Mercenaria mercenaria TaxID=6596 RepID=UPI00234EC2C2|nr:integrin beta-8-like [Mercenaria mercenaria]
MKVIIALLVVTTLAFVYAEHCRDNAACHEHHITQCHGHTHSVCLDNWCECSDIQHGHNCTAQADCPSCPDNHVAHCVDGRCHCAGGRPGQGK